MGTANTLDDRSDGVTISGNAIGPLVRGEAVDLKEGTTGGVVSDNVFDGTGLTNANYYDSWVDVKGNGYLIEGNRGTHTLKDGFQTHSQVDGWGCGTVFHGNSSDLTDAQGTARYAIDVTNFDAATCPTTVEADNTVVGGEGLVNPGVPVTGGDGQTPAPTVTDPTPSDPTPTATATAPPVCTAPAWSSSVAYTGGATVSYDGAVYLARWWTQGDVPTSSGEWGPWEWVEAC